MVGFVLVPCRLVSDCCILFDMHPPCFCRLPSVPDSSTKYLQCPIYPPLALQSSAIRWCRVGRTWRWMSAASRRTNQPTAPIPTHKTTTSFNPPAAVVAVAVGRRVCGSDQASTVSRPSAHRYNVFILMRRKWKSWWDWWPMQIYASSQQIEAGKCT